MPEVVTNLKKNTSGAYFDIAQFDVATFNTWINEQKSGVATITNLTKNTTGAYFDIAQFDVATFNTWINLKKSS